MYSNKHFILISILLLIISTTVSAQTPAQKDSLDDKKNHSLVFHIGGGISRYIGTISLPVGLPSTLHKSNAVFTFRAMWHPNHLLRLGLETGYFQFYNYNIQNGNNPGKVKLTSVPMIIIWSMPVTKRISVFAGFGSNFLTTHLEYLGKVKSTTFSLATELAVSYTHPISKNAGIAAEIKWMNAHETKDQGLSLQIHYVWNFLKW